MFRVPIDGTFDAAHLIEGCGSHSRLHGHTWTVEVVYIYEDSDLGKNTLGLDGRPIEGLLPNVSTLRDGLHTLLPHHEVLNDVFDFNPTSANIAKWLSELIESPHESVRVSTPKHGSVLYFPEPVICDPRLQTVADLETGELVGQVRCSNIGR